MNLSSSYGVPLNIPKHRTSAMAGQKAKKMFVEEEGIFKSSKSKILRLSLVELTNT